MVGPAKRTFNVLHSSFDFIVYNVHNFESAPECVRGLLVSLSELRSGAAALVNKLSHLKTRNYLYLDLLIYCIVCLNPKKISP